MELPGNGMIQNLHFSTQRLNAYNKLNYNNFENMFEQQSN